MDQLSFLFSMTWKILFIVFFFGFCVFIHEFGHLLASLWRGLHVEKFSVGFGKKLWGFSIRGVEYVISLLPFGGYVMLPQLEPTDTPKTSSGEILPVAKPQARIIAAFAGPFFNILFGFFLATIMWMVGTWEAPPAASCVLTEVPAVLPLYKDGLKMTDQVLAVNGTPVEGYWDDICAKLPAKEEKLLLTVKRDGEQLELEYTPEINPEWVAGLRPGYRIVAVNGKKFRKGVEEMTTEYVFTKAATVQLSVLDPAGAQQELQYRPAPNPMMENLGFPFFSAVNPLSVGDVLPNSPAATAGIQKGDLIVEFNGNTVTTAAALAEALALLSPGDTFSLKGMRNELEIDFPAIQMPVEQPAGALSLGLAFNVRAEQVLPGSPAATAGLQHGDTLVALNGKSVTDVDMFIQGIRASEGTQVEVLILRENHLKTVTIVPVLNEQDGQKIFQIGMQLSGTAPKIIGHPTPWKQFTNVADQTARTLELLFSPLTRKIKNLGSAEKQEGPRAGIQVKHMSGPLGIVMMLWYKLKLEGLRGGFAFIILITFSLAMVNLLPLPVLDGGHIVYALLEIIFRRPIPVKVMVALQNTFAVLLIGLMLYITAFDGKRLFQRIRIGIQSAETVEKSEAPVTEREEPAQ